MSVVENGSSFSETEHDEAKVTTFVNCNTLQNLEILRHENEFCDVILQVEGEEFPAHRPVLAASSDYFRTMFTIDMKEKSSKEIHIKSITSEAMKEILKSIYTQKISFSEENISDIVHAASLMQFLSVIDAAAQFVKENISTHNCFRFRDLVRNHPLECLKQVVLSFFLKFMCSIDSLPGYFEFNFDELEKILSSDNLIVKEEKEVYKMLTRWTNHDVEGRKDYFCVLFQYIRLQFIPIDYIIDYIKKNELIKLYHECRDLLEDALEYHIKPKFIHSQKHRNSFVEKPDILMLLPYRQHFQGFYKYEKNSWKKRTFDGLTDGSVWKDCAVANKHPVTVLCGGIQVNKNVTMNIAVCFNGARWLDMPCLNVARCGAAAAIVNNAVYVFGGECDPVDEGEYHHRLDNNPVHSKFCKSFEKLDETGCWEAFENLIVNRSFFSAVVIHDKIYLIGGFKPSVGGPPGGPESLYSQFYRCKRPCSDTDVYCPVSNTWEKSGNLNEARASFSCTVMNSNVYVLGGKSSSSKLYSVEIFNSLESKWTIVKDVLNNHTVLSACSVNKIIYMLDINGKLYEVQIWTDLNNDHKSCTKLASLSHQGILIPFSKGYYKKPIGNVTTIK